MHPLCVDMAPSDRYSQPFIEASTAAVELGLLSGGLYARFWQDAREMMLACAGLGGTGRRQPVLAPSLAPPELTEADYRDARRFGDAASRLYLADLLRDLRFECDPV